MYRNIFLFISLLLCFTAKGQQKEQIHSFDCDIRIEKDGSMTVSETITLYGGIADIRRGIVRSIPVYRTDTLGKKQKMDFEIKDVYRDGEKEKYKIKKEGDYWDIYIGDAAVILGPGIYKYVISYVTSGHIGFFDEFDELYWNVTGNDWMFPIMKASATIHLPDSASVISTHCYTGIYGATDNACQYTVNDSTVTFTSTTEFKPNEGLTVGVSFTRDIIKRPPPPTASELFWEQNKTSICAVLFIVILLCFYYFTWKKVGVDPERHTVVPTFDPPHGWSPALTRYLYKRGYDNKVFTSAIISMAVKGYIRISKPARIFRLEKTQGTEELTEEERKIYHTLFRNNNYIDVSDIHHLSFSSANNHLQYYLKGSWNLENYFSDNRGYAIAGAILSIILSLVYIAITGTGIYAIILLIMSPFVAISMSLISSAVKRAKTGSLPMGRLVLGVLLSIPVFIGAFLFLYMEENSATSVFFLLLLPLWIAYFYLIKAPTELGVVTKAELEGFRMYMKTAEENRLNLLTSPDKTPEVFEKFLPYAIALNVENEWATKFDHILRYVNYQPNWYVDNRPLRYGVFIHTLSNSLNTSLSRAMVDTTPSTVSSGSSRGSGTSSSSSSGGWSSGSRGGGFSGGGGGGGGGRGW